MMDHMTPTKWTSTYNQAYRGSKRFISPHHAQPMYHFSDSYDPSHFGGYTARSLPKVSPKASVEPTLPPIDQTTTQVGLPAVSPPRNLYSTGTKPLTGVYSNSGLAMPNPADVIGTGTASRPVTTSWISPMSTLRMQERQRYFIPGYQGFVRGEQFRHGETYGQTTRRCLDVPTSVPLDG